jgi:hypothetical protein
MAELMALMPMQLRWVQLLLHMLISSLSSLAISYSVGTSINGSGQRAPAAPFHVVRSTRWPCLQFGEACTRPGSNAFAGALIMRNASGTSRLDGLPCGSALRRPDPLDAGCYTTPAQVRAAAALVAVGDRVYIQAPRRRLVSVISGCPRYNMR